MWKVKRRGWPKPNMATAGIIARIAAKWSSPWWSRPKGFRWAKTMTWKGLHPVVRLCEKVYAKGVPLGKAAKTKLEEQLHRLPTLPKWDVRIEPRPLV